MTAAELEPTVLDTEDLSWRSHGACSSVPGAVDLFYADEAKERELVDRARAICTQCPVQMQCLDYALVVEEPDGVWGGASASERRRIARRVHGTPARFRARCRCTPCLDANARRAVVMANLSGLLPRNR